MWAGGLSLMLTTKELPEVFQEKGRISAQEIGAWTSITVPQTHQVPAVLRNGGDWKCLLKALLRESYSNRGFYHGALPCCHKVIKGGIMDQLAKTYG